MMYNVMFSDDAEKEFFKLELQLQERISKCLERIRVRPLPHLTKLVNSSLYRLRIGDYRVLVDIDEPNLILFIIKIGHRKNIYNLNL